MVKGRQTVRLPQQHRKTDDASKTNPDNEPAVQPNIDPLSLKSIRKALSLALPLLALAALVSPISQATLRPVYGSLPSSVNHTETITATVLLGFLWRHFAGGYLEADILPYLTFWSFWLPVVQIYMFKRSEQWGPVGGPIITGFISCHTLIIPSAYAAAQALERLDLQGQLGAIAGVAIPALALDLGYFRPLEYAFSQAIEQLLAKWSPALDPVKLQYVVAGTYALISPSKPYWMLSLGLPSLLVAFLANPHLDSPRTLGIANRDLAVHNWTIVDRQWSNTGYVSVIESSDMQYRALRCDHSLLGGEWLLTPERQKQGWRTSEPIYAVFAMLEAVRLIEIEPPVPDTAAQALVVGLGIGTAPKALMAHGISTTVVELDPIVHRYATRYFNLPKEHTAVLQDAVSWVSEQATNKTSRYDYIIHDVFTGGAEPLPLFTDTFLHDLRSLLTPNGIIALNYAGDLKLPLTSLILSTIQRAFNGHCKIFRDTPAPSAEEADKANAQDFINMIVFCRNSPGSITFRAPTKKDMLGSRQRETYLLPRADFEIAFPSASSDAVKVEILRKGDEGKWRREQEESAIRHWHIMRRVLPAMVWETW